MGVTGLPTVQLFVGSEGLVDQFQQKASQIDALRYTRGCLLFFPLRCHIALFSELLGS